jgi:hypothetical protein
LEVSSRVAGKSKIKGGQRVAPLCPAPYHTTFSQGSNNGRLSPVNYEKQYFERLASV